MFALTSKLRASVVIITIGSIDCRWVWLTVLQAILGLIEKKGWADGVI